MSSRLAAHGVIVTRLALSAGTRVRSMTILRVFRLHPDQRTVMFSGIPREGKLQDIAVMESMQTVADRVREHLGRSDGMIILMRRTLVNAAKALKNAGELHPTVDNASM